MKEYHVVVILVILVIIAICFGIFMDTYCAIKKAEAGLQQCVVGNLIVWQKECK